MRVPDMSDPQRSAMGILAVAADLDGIRRNKRPCRASNRTSHQIGTTEMLTVHWKIADQLAAAGLIRITNDVLRTLELTDAGREAAREAGLG